jgi:PII-like signaling protein
MIVAVGPAAALHTALPQLRTVLSDPLFTVEPVEVCKRDGRLLRRPAPVPPVDATGLTRWQRLTVTTTESARHGGVPIHRALLRRLRDADAAGGATLLRGHWGFHGSAAPGGDRLWQLDRQVPVSTVVIDTPERIAATFAIVDELTTGHGLVTADVVPALVSVRDGSCRGGLRLAAPEV